jgi:uncharacterized membrane protein YesL
MATESKLFDPEGPLMTGFDTVKDLITLNLLTIICSIPVVTIGASFTAMHYTALKMVRNEEGYIHKTFFKSFKENLKQGIGATFIMAFAFGFIGLDFWATQWFQEDPGFVKAAIVLLILMAAVTITTVTFFFPVQAKLSATLKQNISNAFKMALSHFPMTLLMILFDLLPFIICYFLHFLIPLLFIFGFSLPAFWDAKLYNKIFIKIEEAAHAGKDI